METRGPEHVAELLDALTAEDTTTAACYRNFTNDGRVSRDEQYAGFFAALRNDKPYFSMEM